MTQSLEERINYHPLPFAGLWQRGYRRVDDRLTAILKHVDVSGKTVLDLGCSGGYFSFRLSKIARHVVAIDGDREVIEHNQEIASKYGYPNISFQHAHINVDLLKSLPVFDVTIFLSVFQHMLTASAAYDWNKTHTHSEALATMAAIRARSKLLVFEMGYPDEGHEWCERLPEMLPTTQNWIIQNIFGADFDHVQVINSPAYKGLGGSMRRLVARRRIANPVVAKVIRRFFSLDPRDGRDIFIGTRNI